MSTLPLQLRRAVSRKAGRLSLPLRILLASGLLISPVTDPLKASDAKGSADHPLIRRLEGSSILYYSKKAYDSLFLAEEDIVLADDDQLYKDLNAQKVKPYKQETVEGALTRILYLMPENVSTLEVERQYEAELEGKGFEILCTRTGRDVASGAHDTFCYQVYHSSNLPFDVYDTLACYVGKNDSRYVAARLTRPEGNVYVRLYAVAHGRGLIPEGHCGALLDVLEVKPLKARMVTVSSTEMDSQIHQAGHIALYGIYFDFNKAEVKPESEPTLAEIGKLMSHEQGLNVLVAGHTDNVGGFEFNRELSQRRATAVVDALVSRYGVSRQRLFPYGLSYAAPVASNETEQGRAKNRRVELVRY